MKLLNLLFVLFSISIVLYSSNDAYACSMYKVSMEGKTMVGCNHDTWYLTPRIWFETDGYGAAFTGARVDGANGFAPQSGMNEYGLAFSRLEAATPVQNNTGTPKKVIVNPSQYLKDILHQCKNVEEVEAFVRQYDRSLFIHDVFIFVDRTGKYLIVEPYITTIGNEPYYVLGNFCPSQITDFESIRQARYINGSAFLKSKIDTSLRFCKELSDTMHVCRAKIGDGTLITSIWDLRDGNIALYFYHDYEQEAKFNLNEELTKGNHIIDVTTLFPPNKEFEKLANFKTPLNSVPVEMFLRFCLVFFLILSLYYLFSYFRKRRFQPYSNIKLGLFFLNSVMIYFIFILSTKINIYYFPSPYKEHNFSLVNIAAYLPFLILLLIIPLLRFNKIILRKRIWSMFSIIVLTVNSLVFLTLIALFSYWGLYDIF